MLNFLLLINQQATECLEVEGSNKEENAERWNTRTKNMNCWYANFFNKCSIDFLVLTGKIPSL